MRTWLQATRNKRNSRLQLSRKTIQAFHEKRATLNAKIDARLEKIEALLEEMQ